MKCNKISLIYIRKTLTGSDIIAESELNFTSSHQYVNHPQIAVENGQVDIAIKRQSTDLKSPPAIIAIIAIGDPLAHYN